MFSSHVLSVSGAQGLFVPVDFRHPLPASGVPGEMLGSSQAALRELVRVAPLLEIELADGALSDETSAGLFATEDGSHPLWIERRVWHTFYELARASVAYKTALILH